MTGQGSAAPAFGELPEERARQLLAFAAANPVVIRVDDAVRRELGLTTPRYLQLLNRLIQTEQALRIDPMTTHRLRRRAADAETTRRTRVGSNR